MCKHEETIEEVDNWGDLFVVCEVCGEEVTEEIGVSGAFQ